jgi:hypothetical protein
LQHNSAACQESENCEWAAIDIRLDKIKQSSEKLTLTVRSKAVGFEGSSKGYLPTRSRYKTTPADQTSAAYAYNTPTDMVAGTLRVFC